MNSVRLLVIAALLAVFVAPVQADVLLSNLGEPLRAFNTLDQLEWAAQGFETDANSYLLTDIQAIVGGEVGSSGAFAEIRSSTSSGDMDTSAGGLLSTFSVPSLSGPRTARTFTPTSTVNLAPNTRYYFALGATGPGTYEWSYAEGNGSTGPGSFSQYEYTFDGGGTWASFGTDNPFHLQVNVSSSTSAVPEPATSALLVSSGIAVMLLRRRVKSSKK